MNYSEYRMLTPVVFFDHIQTELLKYDGFTVSDGKDCVEYRSPKLAGVHSFLKIEKQHGRLMRLVVCIDFQYDSPLKQLYRSQNIDILIRNLSVKNTPTMQNHTGCILEYVVKRMVARIKSAATRFTRSRMVKTTAEVHKSMAYGLSVVQDAMDILGTEKAILTASYGCFEAKIFNFIDLEFLPIRSKEFQGEECVYIRFHSPSNINDMAELLYAMSGIYKVHTMHSDDYRNTVSFRMNLENGYMPDLFRDIQETTMFKRAIAAQIDTETSK